MRQALGRGLDALIPVTAAAATTPEGGQKVPFLHVPIDSLRPNRFQPRKQFDDGALEELAQSIKDHGLTQPIVVTKDPAGYYEIVAGERRWRASRKAGLNEVPVVVMDSLTNQQRLAVAIIENIQRADLNAIEEARAFRQLMVDFQMSQADVAKTVAKSRSAVANTMRLLELPEEIQAEIMKGNLSEGHGRALLMVSDIALRKGLCEETLSKHWSVRELEDAARRAETRRLPSAKPQAAVPVEIKALETELQQKLGTKVRVHSSKKGVGSLRIEFYSLEDLERLASQLRK